MCAVKEISIYNGLKDLGENPLEEVRKEIAISEVLSDLDSFPDFYGCYYYYIDDNTIKNRFDFYLLYEQLSNTIRSFENYSSYS